MVEQLGERAFGRRAWSWLVVAGILSLAVLLGERASALWLLLLAAGLAGVALLRAPDLGLLGVVAAALVVRIRIPTGTEVNLNVATLLVPAIFGLWLIEGPRRLGLRWAASPVNRPLTLFLVAGLLSLLVGNVLWDPAIPKSDSFWLVQLAQWAILAIAAVALWLTANVLKPGVWLPRLTWTFLALGGGLALLRLLPGWSRVVAHFTTASFIRAPFWALLVAVAGGQLLFNSTLCHALRVVLGGLIVGAVIFAFFLYRGSSSTWVGVSVALAVLGWLRWPKLRWPVLILIAALALSGTLFASVYEFAGGDEDWVRTGGSRLALIERVLTVTLRNPITGLGPASYRAYANREPLKYGNATWYNPLVNSHNNWVDLFAHTGLLGLGLFIWFAVELGLLGWRLSRRHREGFVAGYVSGMLGVWIASLVLMLFADWILPFVYNIGFDGFQASLLVWLFVGGLVAVDRMDRQGAWSYAGTPDQRR